MMAEYCCGFACELHGRCETEYTDGCSPCEFQYDCEFCRCSDECGAKAEMDDDWDDDWSDTE